MALANRRGGEPALSPEVLSDPAGIQLLHDGLKDLQVQVLGDAGRWDTGPFRDGKVAEDDPQPQEGSSPHHPPQAPSPTASCGVLASWGHSL